jgi:hypothetical protein
MTREPTATPPFADAEGRAWDRRVLLGCGVALAAAVVFALVAPLPALLYRITDDAYYYFNVARNVVLGHGLTFDRMNATNGFHPLWMLVLIPVFAVMPNDPERALRLVFVCVALVAVASGWAAYRAASRLAGRTAALVVLPALISPLLSNPVLSGLETGLLVWLLYEFFGACERDDLLATHASTTRNLTLGLSLAALFLCRLDTVFLGFGLVAVLLPRFRMAADRGALVRKLAIVSLAACPPVAIYLGWNALRFHHWMPISGMLKSTFPVVSFSARELGFLDTLIGEACLGVATVVLGLAWIRPAWFEGPGARFGSSGWLAVTAAWFGAWLHFLNRLLFMNWGVYWWHFASYGPVALLALALALRPIVRRPRAAIATAWMLLGLSLATLWFDTRHRGEKQERWIQAATWARSHLPTDAVIGMTDCGLFGYLSDRRTVNLDGVINSFAYWQALRERRLDRFLADEHVTHFGYHAVQYRDGVFVARIPAHVLGEPDAVIVTTPDAEVFRSEPYSQGLYVLWDARKVQFLNDARDIPEALARLRR